MSTTLQHNTQRRWMTLVCVLSFATNRGAVVARAWSPAINTVLTKHRGGSTAAALKNPHHWVRQGSSTARSDARTGWMHNQPEDDEEQQLPPSVPAPSSSSSDDNTEARTGWLHNTESPVTESSSAVGAGFSEAQRLLQQAMKTRERNHRMIAPPAFHTGPDSRVLVVTEHKVSVPVYRLDDDKKDRTDLYFSIVETLDDADRVWWDSLQSKSATQRATDYVENAALANADEMMIYLQGGPGFGAPTPIVGLGLSSPTASWASKALSMYSRIILMDQRGTGRSTPITKQRLEQDFPDLFALDGEDNAELLPALNEFPESFPAEHAKVQEALKETTEYMAQFRADNIVRDAEEIKDILLLPNLSDKPRPYGCALGQSFGGFCMMTYLSQIAHPPRICLLTGGIAPMLTPVYDVYDKLWDRVKERSLRYYDMYPADIEVVKKIVKALLETPARLPSGSKLTARRFLQIGLGLGGSPSSFASLHNLFNTAMLNPDNEEDTVFTRAFLKAMDSHQSFDDHPLYFLMHESIYADSNNNSPTNWMAHHAYEARVKTPSEFDYRLTAPLKSDARPTLFFAEMVFPWMADGDFAEVSGLGMRSLAQALAEKDDWGPLYDKEHMRRVLDDGSISRAAAAVYYEDLYVDFDACMKVTARGGPLEKCKVWVSNEYQHSGLRDDGAAIFAKIHGMAKGNIRTPS